MLIVVVVGSLPWRTGPGQTARRTPVDFVSVPLAAVGVFGTVVRTWAAAWTSPEHSTVADVNPPLAFWWNASSEESRYRRVP